ncbi:MAG: G1 family glutamic endopeptidase, partial [Ktedonobacterales bacterium]
RGVVMRKKLLILAPTTLLAGALVAALAVMLVGPHTASAEHAAFLTHHSVPAIHHSHNGKHSTSSNWSGYASTGTKYTDVKGSWVEPTATCSSGQTAYSSFWVGIDGDTTGTVEQLGTDTDCSSGTPTYYGWWEMYPKGSNNLSTSSYPVRPGDTISAEVSTNGSGSFTLKMTDSTRGWTFTTNQSSRKAKLGSAEWIAEAPSSGGVLPLANFGTVSFSNCTANGASISANPNPDAITMAANGVTKAVPSGLGSGGASFSVTWKHS